MSVGTLSTISDGDIWVRIGRRVEHDETRIVVRKTKWCWREMTIFRLDRDNHSFLCGCTVKSRGSVIDHTRTYRSRDVWSLVTRVRSTLGGVLPMTHRPTGHVSRSVLPRGSHRLRHQGVHRLHRRVGPTPPTTTSPPRHTL